MLLLNEAKPKYDYLDIILEDQLNNIKFSQQTNVIVDLKGVFKKFFRPDFQPTTQQSREELTEEVASDILNIISHYRNYFFKKGKFTTFYFLYSITECEELKAVFPDYKKEYYNNYFNSEENKEKIIVIQKAVRIIEKVLRIIPNTVFIDTSKHDEFVYTRYITEASSENELNLILSNDTIFYQLLNSHTFLINLKGIKSKLVSKENAIEVITKRDDFKFSSVLLSLVLSLSGEKKYSVKSIPTVALIKACNIVSHLLEEQIINQEETISFPIEFTKLDPKNKMDKLLIENKDKIVENYSLIRNDKNYFENKLYIQGEFLSAAKKLKVGKNVFLDLNAKIFSRFPLQLDMMLKGENI